MDGIACIKVREVHGIRRFLYPLTAVLVLPEGWPQARLGLARAEGTPVPFQITPEQGERGRVARIDFAISLAPHEEADLILGPGIESPEIDDPIRTSGSDPYRCEQRRFRLELDRQGLPHQAVYDGRAHLRGPGAIRCNGSPATPAGPPAFAAGPLVARLSSPGEYPGKAPCLTMIESSACKSWAVSTHVLLEPRPGDEVCFTLPVDVASPAPTCDFGVGGGIYARLGAGSAPEISWRTEFLPDGGARWSWFSGGRLDCRGTEESGGRYRPQRWFHLIDGDRALAAAIATVPRSCRMMTAAVSAEGDCTVTFRLGEEISGPAAFGICWHFLNGIPAVAAATNPQSILLAPLVEVTAAHTAGTGGN